MQITRLSFYQNNLANSNLNLKQRELNSNNINFRSEYANKPVTMTLKNLNIYETIKPSIDNVITSLKQFLVFNPQVREADSCLNFLENINIYQAEIVRDCDPYHNPKNRNITNKCGSDAYNNIIVNLYDKGKGYKISGLLIKTLPDGIRETNIILHYLKSNTSVLLKTKNSNLVIAEYKFKKYTNTEKQDLLTTDTYIYKPTNEGNLLELHTQHKGNNTTPEIDNVKFYSKFDTFIDEIKGHISPKTISPVKKTNLIEEFLYTTKTNKKTKLPLEISQKNINSKNTAKITFYEDFKVEYIELIDNNSKLGIRFDKNGNVSKIQLTNADVPEYCVKYRNDLLLYANGKIYQKLANSFFKEEHPFITQSSYLVDKITTSIKTPKITKKGLVWNTAPFDMSRFEKQQESLFEYLNKNYPLFNEIYP